MAIPHQTRAVA